MALGEVRKRRSALGASCWGMIEIVKDWRVSLSKRKEGEEDE